MLEEHYLKKLEKRMGEYARTPDVFLEAFFPGLLNELNNSGEKHLALQSVPGWKSVSVFRKQHKVIYPVALTKATGDIFQDRDTRKAFTRFTWYFYPDIPISGLNKAELSAVILSKWKKDLAITPVRVWRYGQLVTNPPKNHSGQASTSGIICIASPSLLLIIDRYRPDLSLVKATADNIADIGFEIPDSDLERRIRKILDK